MWTLCPRHTGVRMQLLLAWLLKPQITSIKIISEFSQTESTHRITFTSTNYHLHGACISPAASGLSLAVETEF